MLMRLLFCQGADGMGKFLVVYKSEWSQLDLK